MRELELNGFSLGTCLACAQASMDAYTVEPTVHSPLAHAVIREAQGAVIVAFRGTQEPRDFVTDAACWMEKKQRPGFGSLHHGFGRAHESVVVEVMGALLRGAESARLVVTGHSLGGAMAMLCAREISLCERLKDRLEAVYTFAQPRVGGGDWAHGYDQARVGHDRVWLGSRSWRLVNQVDIVPRTPGLLMGYRHCGTEVFLTPAGEMIMQPPLWKKLWWDAVTVYGDYRAKRLGALCDHHMSHYLERVKTAAAAAAPAYA